MDAVDVIGIRAGVELSATYKYRNEAYGMKLLMEVYFETRYIYIKTHDTHRLKKKQAICLYLYT